MIKRCVCLFFWGGALSLFSHMFFEGENNKKKLSEKINGTCDLPSSDFGVGGSPLKALKYCLMIKMHLSVISIS